MENNDFKQIYDQYFDMVYKISLLYLKNTKDAEDMVQEIFLKLLKQQQPFNSKEHIKAWLIRTTKNACIDLNRSFWKSHQVDIEHLPEVAIEEANDLSDVLEQLLLLPDKYKIVLYLFYYEEYSIKEIANIMKLKESTIQTQLARGRKLLEKRLRRIEYGKKGYERSFSKNGCE